MSWDSYIDNLIAATTDHADRAGIIGKDGSQWTTAYGGKGIVLQGNEAAAIAQCFSSSNFQTFMASGVVMEGYQNTI